MSKKDSIFREVISTILITAGALLAAFSLEEFLIPNLILDGGVNGVSIILGNLTGVAVSIFVIVLNIPFLLIGYKNLGKKFLAKSIFAMLVFSIALAFFEPKEEVTQDLLLATVYGGIILGLGVGLVIRYGGCLDGTETIAILISKKTNFSVGQIVLAFNFVIYSVAGLLFGLDRALYSLLVYFITFKIIDLISEGLEQAKAVYITTSQAEKIANEIFTTLGRTVTFLPGEGLINGKNTTLYCVVTRLELSEIRKIIEDDDIQAFATITDVSEVIGTHIKKVPKAKKVKEKRLKHKVLEHNMSDGNTDSNTVQEQILEPVLKSNIEETVESKPQKDKNKEKEVEKI